MFLNIGFSTLEQEFSNRELPVEGKIPIWLSGSLIRNGAAKFSVGRDNYNHWFDGLAMLHKFEFKKGLILYSNRFLQGNTYKRAIKEGRIVYPEFATIPKSPLLKRVYLNVTGQFTDNASVNVFKINRSYVALTETPPRVEFDPTTLDTIGQFKYCDNIKGHLTTVHPHYDYPSGNIFNYITQFSLISRYNIYKISKGTKNRKLINSIPTKHPSYMHSFGITENYIILSQFPLFIDPIRLLRTGTPFAENLFWRPEHGTNFLIISKVSGEVVARIKAEPFFAFHHINSFEKDGEIIIDLVAYENPQIIKSVYLNKLLQGDRSMPIPQLRRYKLNIRNCTASYKIISEDYTEFPRINYQGYNSKDYNYIYGLMDHNSNGFLSKLVKVSTKGEPSKYWYKENNYPGEPVFVPYPNGVREDDGIILSMVLDSVKKITFLLILDAVSFKEIGRAYLPFAVPFGSHGQYFD